MTGSVEYIHISTRCSVSTNKPTCGGLQTFVDIAPHLTTIRKTPPVAIVSTFSCVVRPTMAKPKQKKVKKTEQNNRVEVVN